MAWNSLRYTNTNLSETVDRLLLSPAMWISTRARKINDINKVTVTSETKVAQTLLLKREGKGKKFPFDGNVRDE